MRGIEIRDAGVADLAGLYQLEIDSFDSDRLTRRSMRHLISSRSASLRVATAAAAIVGYHVVLFRRGNTNARLYSLAVAGRVRDRGLGRALMADAERVAAGRNCRTLRLEVRRDNHRAIRLYERLGYRRIGTYRGYYDDATDAIRFEKALGSTRRRSRPGEPRPPAVVGR